MHRLDDCWTVCTHACAEQCVGVSGCMSLPKGFSPLQPFHVSFIRAVLQWIVWRNSELIVWFYASSFKQGSHMAPCTVKWAILWRARRRCADRRAETPGTHREWTVLTVLCTFAVISQKIGPATEALSNQYANIPHPEASSQTLLYHNKAGDSQKPKRKSKKLKNEPSPVPRALTLWCCVNQHMIENKGVYISTDQSSIQGWPWHLKCAPKLLAVVFVTAAFHLAHCRRLRCWLQIIISVKWNLIK